MVGIAVQTILVWSVVQIFCLTFDHEFDSKMIKARDRLISYKPSTLVQDHPLSSTIVHFGSLGPFTLDLTPKIMKVYAIPDYDFVAAVQSVDKDIASGKLKSAPKFDDTRRLQDLTTGK